MEHINQFKKTGSYLSKAAEHLKQQQERVEKSKSELKEVNDKLETLKSELNHVSSNQQESKLNEIDKLVSRKSLLEMRIQLLSGSNKEIQQSIELAINAFIGERNQVSKKTQEENEKLEKMRSDHLKAVEEARIEMNKSFADQHTAMSGIKNALISTGMSQEQATSFMRSKGINV